MAEDSVEYIVIQAGKAKGQAEQAAREAKEAVAEHQKEILRGATTEILKHKKVAAQLAKEHATMTAEVQKMAELAAEQAVANVKRKEEKIGSSLLTKSYNYIIYIFITLTTLFSSIPLITIPSSVAS
jgi:ribosomal protein L17